MVAMILDAQGFQFCAPGQVGRARRVLIKPDTSRPRAHPMSPSYETLAAIVDGIRRAGDADIYLLDSGEGQSAPDVFKQLGYDFPRVIAVDVRDCVLVEVENPLPKPFALQTIWLPNLLLSCDYLISVATYRVDPGAPGFTLRNLVSLLLGSKYRGESGIPRETIERLGIENIVADLYFTIPFDLGIVDARERAIFSSDAVKPVVDRLDRVYVGDVLELDTQLAQESGIDLPHLHLIAEGQRLLQDESSAEPVPLTSVRHD